MSAAVHHIVDGRFICSAGSDAKCHRYPSCECEQWTREIHGQQFGEVIGFSNGHALYANETIAPEPGHEAIQQDECWMQGWMDGTDLWESYDLDEKVRDNDEFPDGAIEYEWHGDYLTWRYVKTPTFREPVDA